MGKGENADSIYICLSESMEHYEKGRKCSFPAFPPTTFFSFSHNFFKGLFAQGCQKSSLGSNEL